MDGSVCLYIECTHMSIYSHACVSEEIGYIWNTTGRGRCCGSGYRLKYQHSTRIYKGVGMGPIIMKGISHSLDKKVMLQRALNPILIDITIYLLKYRIKKNDKFCSKIY